MQRLGVKPSRSGGREGYGLAGVRPRLTLRTGTRCRLSACDIRFVGPTLFTSELTGHEWRPLAVTIRSHQVDSLAATPVASVARLAADLRLERSASGLTIRFPRPVGLSAKISWSGVRESNPPLLLGRQRPKATRPTPLKSRALCFALRLPVSMRRIVACAGLWAGVFGWSESGSELSLPICPRPCAGGKAKSELDRGDSGHKLPEQRTTQRRAMGARGCAGIEKFSDGYEHGSRFLRASDSEVKRRVNTQRGR